MLFYILGTLLLLFFLDLLQTKSIQLK